jgi:magnesium-transporting ATPase (P-type)
MYFSFIAASTIGFGDIAPVSFAAQAYTMFLAIYGIVIIALVSAIFVTGFTNGAKAYKSIQAKNNSDRADIYRLMIQVDARIKLNIAIDR